jgi:hypothetical protein
MEDQNEDLFGLTNEEFIKRFTLAIKLENERKLAKGVPIAKFDEKINKAYLEYPDGSKKYY